MTPLQPIDLRVENLTKSFYGMPAIDSVDLRVVGGQVHGLLGENGAGKSTLCSVLSGLYRPDGGRITLGGQQLDLRSPHDASAHGIGMVHQHFRLVDTFTAAQNIALGMGRKLGGRSMSKINAQVVALADDYGLHVDPTAVVWHLSIGEQQRVAILKQLFRGAEILILDEPTAVLARHEADRLFDAVDALTSNGHAVILVSHKMTEVLEQTDHITVLRDGRNAGDVTTADTTAEDVARMMFGERNVAADPIRRGPRTAPTVGEPVLRVSGLRVEGDRGFGAVDDVSFSVRRGEIVGLAGVAGNGQRELHEAIAGLRTPVGGTIIVGTTDCSTAGPNERMHAGMSYVPEDRLGTGLAPGLSLEHNMVLKNHDQPPHSARGVLSVSNIKATTAALVAEFDVRGGHDGLPVSLMSGGNLQKAILARELTQPHDLLVAAAPTRGLDTSAAATVRSHILAERDKGNGVLLISEDLDEIIGLADVVMVMSEGRIVGTFTGDELDVDEIGLLMAAADRLLS